MRGKVRYYLLTAAILAMCILLYPRPAYAMHIAEGILPAEWALIWFIPALIFLGIGLYIIKKKTAENRALLPLLGLTGALIFLISVFPIPVPIAGTSSHPCGTPLGALLAGPFMTVVLGGIALLLQALFLGDGGFSTWGANMFAMAVVGSFAGFGSFVLFKKLKAPLFLCGFAAGLLGDWATYLTTSFQLASATHGSGSLAGMFGATTAAFAITQVPIGILEGIFTGGVVVLLQQRRPQILQFVLITPNKPD